MMGEFIGAYGDERRAAAVARLHEAMVERRTVVVRKLGGDRKGEVSAHLALASPPVTAPETIACLARRTGQAVSGRRVAVAQDTTEVAFPGPRSRLRGFALRDGSLRDGVAPLHRRPLTTLPAGTGAEAAEAVRLYRLRWRIEQTWRTFKAEGLRIEEARTYTPHRLLNLAALALGAAVRVIQLVDARDGGPRPASDVADGGQLAAAAALCPTPEGGTEWQRNPHPPGSLAWLSWITARLGGWNCYGKPPGPKTMHDGWRRFAAIAEGYALSRAATHDACIP